MLQRIRRNLSFANVTSMLALTIALGGTSYAAIKLPSNSVGSAQIKAKAIKNSDLASNSVTSSKVKDASLLKKDFASGELPAGPSGPAGTPGAPGATGAPGPAGVIGSIIVHRTDVALPAGAGAGVAGASTSGFATCAAGQKLIGGSASIGNVTDPPTQEIVVSRPAADDVGSGAVPADGASMTFWKGTARTLTNVAGTMRVFAYCAVA